MVCALCNQPIHPEGHNVWRRVSGFEKVRRSGEGVHPLKEREFSSDYVHGLCLEVKARGGQQERLAL